MFFFSLRRTLRAAPCWRPLGGIPDYSQDRRSVGVPDPVVEVRTDYFFGFFLPATVFFLPLRVRALVCVR